MLVLFDIDGTLLHCGRQVGTMFVGALREVFGEYGSLANFSFGGKTDPMIVHELVGATGRPADEIHAGMDAVRDRYLDRLDRELDPAGMKVLPGVQELLERLAQRDDLLIGLLTGNWSRGAAIKLGRFGLEGYFRLGAYGEDARDRRGLVPVAMRRAEALVGRAYPPEQVLIVGDTVLDVDCARQAGALCAAVATGWTSADALREAGADWVFADLHEAARLLPHFLEHEKLDRVGKP